MEENTGNNKHEAVTNPKPAKLNQGYLPSETVLRL
jgi:hypothetical protein